MDSENRWQALPDVGEWRYPPRDLLPVRQTANPLDCQISAVRSVHYVADVGDTEPVDHCRDLRQRRPGALAVQSGAFRNDGSRERKAPSGRLPTQHQATGIDV